MTAGRYTGVRGGFQNSRSELARYRWPGSSVRRNASATCERGSTVQKTSSVIGAHEALPYLCVIADTTE